MGLSQRNIWPLRGGLARLAGLSGLTGPSLWRTILLAALVGVVAGLGAVLFHAMTLLVGHYALVELAGYAPGGPKNETRLEYILPPESEHAFLLNPLMLLAVMTVGGLISGFIVYRWAPEAEGHGTDAALEAYHENRGVIRPRVPIIKTIASAVTLGTGGSGGREGPIAQIGAGFGSYLGTKLGLPEAQRRTLLTAGLGAGIGAIFHAPLAGAIFAIEVLYRDPDFEAEGLIPAFIATTVAYSLFAFLFGPDVLGLPDKQRAFLPLFQLGSDLTYTRPFVLLPPLAVLALLMSLAGTLYVRTFYGIHDLFHRLKMPVMLKPALGALLAGLVGVGLYYATVGVGDEAQRQSLGVLYVGYGFLQSVLSGEIITNIGPMVWIVLLAVGLGKMVTTGLTIGSGGSGGVFGPSMVIGGALGALVGIGFHGLMPGIVRESDMVIFAILGMASFFAAAAKTPVSTLIMVSELTGGYALLMPAMWCCALAYLSSGKTTLYREQKRTKRESPAHRGDFIIDVLKGLTVRQALPDNAKRFETVSLGTPLPELGQLVTTTTQSTFPLVDDEGAFYGLFSLDDLRAFLYSDLGSLAVAQDLATTHIEPLTLQMDLSTALGRFAQEHFAELPVVDEEAPDQIVALLRRGDLVREYNRRLLAMQDGGGSAAEISETQEEQRV